jgi:hypothetical protein
VLTVIGAVSSCSSCEADRFRTDHAPLAEIVDWADQQVFTKSFSTDATNFGMLVGPGQDALRLKYLGVDRTAAWPEAEVRVVLDDLPDEGAIFFANCRVSWKAQL